MGLERFLVGLYGTTPQIDLEAQITRTRVTSAVTIDFPKLAEGVEKNNMGLGGFNLVARATIADGKARLASGQTFRFAGAPPPGPGPHLLKYRVLEWTEAEPVLEIAP